jgi:ATP diphosphatase
MDAREPSIMSDPFERLRQVMARLRDPDSGCPWDLKQDFDSIAPYTIEEAYEVADAIQRGDLDGLRDELGDLLFQVYFHARMAEEEGAFDVADVARSVGDKLVRRHPHVFGDRRVASDEELRRHWERDKLAEKDADASALDGVGPAMPALMRAAKLQRRAAAVGFDWPESAPVVDKIREELDELDREMEEDEPVPERLEEEMGDLLFACVNLARHLRLDPEAALRRANAKFERRFRSVEQQARDSGQDPAQLPLETLDGYWDRAKDDESGS